MFSEQDRKIFRYCNGVGNLCADPIRIERKLYLHCDGDLWAVYGKAFPADGEKVIDQGAQDVAMDKFINAVRQAFEMIPFNAETGIGATEEDCQNAFCEWYEFMSAKKKSAGNSPTSPALPAGPAISPTPISTDSGSTFLG